MPQKTFKALILEIVLFVSLFALVGHMSVNFWERYFIQNELSKMKSSLNSLKDTITNLGMVYNELHKELQGLADIAERKTNVETLKNLLENELDGKSTVAQNLLQDMQVQAMGGNFMDDDGKVKIIRFGNVNNERGLNIQDKKIQTAANKNTQIGRNVTPVDVTLRKDVGVNVYAKARNIYAKNVAVITKYPPKTVAAGTEEDSSGLTAYTYRCPKTSKSKQGDTNIHRCHDDLYCSAENREYDYSKF